MSIALRSFLSLDGTLSTVATTFLALLVFMSAPVARKENREESGLGIGREQVGDALEGDSYPIGSVVQFITEFIDALLQDESVQQEL